MLCLVTSRGLRHKVLHDPQGSATVYWNSQALMLLYLWRTLRARAPYVVWHVPAGSSEPYVMNSRTTHRYILRDGRQIVQFGITNGAVERAQEHLRDRKRFTTMTVVGPAVTRDTAVDWERGRIETYQRTHDGKRPRYNKM